MSGDQILIFGCLVWLAGLTGFVVSASVHKSTPGALPPGPKVSGPTMIANFMRDKFGNIVKRNKRPPILRDDETAYLKEQDG